MDTLVHADIFFFITTIAVVLITIFLAVALVYVLKILIDVKYIVGRFREESDLLVKDLRDLRAHVRAEGFQLKWVTNFLAAIYRRIVRKRSK